MAESEIGNNQISSVAASKLTGALPAIDGSALTNLNPTTTGTFTPAFSSTSATDPDASIASDYDIQEGFYTRTGDLVHIDITLKTDSTAWNYVNGAAAGQNLTVVNLPFTIKNSTNYYPSIFVGYFSDFSGWSAGYTPMGYGVPNTKRINMTYATTNTAGNMITTHIGVLASTIYLSLTYKTDDA